jgi:integrase
VAQLLPVIAKGLTSLANLLFGPVVRGVLSRRSWSLLIDGFVCVGVWGSALSAVGARDNGLAAAVGLLATCCVYYIVLTGLAGATLGKLVFKHRVVNLADGGKPGLWRATRRMVSIVVPLGFGQVPFLPARYMRTDPLWARPARSSNITNRHSTCRFVAAYGHMPIRAIGDGVVAEWLNGGRNVGTVPALRALFNDAASAPAGRLVDRNPFAKLGLRSSRGRRDTQLPTQADIARFIALADELTPPSFAAFLHTAVYEGMRPGELDALAWAQLDFQAGTIHVDRQWNANEHEFTQPKHGSVRTIAMTEPVRDRLLTLPRESEWVFTTVRGSHYRPSSRSHHWNRVRCSAELGNVDLYTATRHYFGWYAWNVLGLDPRDIALHFGHQDGGELVRKLYGHADAALARDRVREAFRQAPPLPAPLLVTSRLPRTHAALELRAAAE